MKYLLFSLLFLLNCIEYSKSRYIEKEQKIRLIESFDEELVEDCDDKRFIPTKIPSSVNSISEFKNKLFFEYCIKFDTDDTSINGLNLGYIDNEYIIYLNGEILSRATNDKNLPILFYDKEVILKLPQLLTKNILIVRVKKLSNEDLGGGIYSGIQRIDSFTNLIREKYILEYYEFGKIVLFYSTCILFFVLYLSKRSNRELLYFGIFLFCIASYYATRLEVRYELGINLVFTKRLEFFFLSITFPVFIQFIYLLIKRSNRDGFVHFSYLMEGLVILSYIYYWDIPMFRFINLKYHTSFMILGFLVLAYVLIHEAIKRNRRAKSTIYILILPFLSSLFQLLNNKFEIAPEFSNISLIGDSVLLLVIFMTGYISYQFYTINKKLDLTIAKEANIRRIFQRYVPPTDIEKILHGFNEKDEILSSGEKEVQIIFFCDIRDFTSLTEKMRPEDVVDFLNSYFKRFNKIIIEKGGVIDKLIGDCIMARFPKGKETSAISAAISFMDELNYFNNERKSKRLFQILHGVGINIGDVIVGNIGSINKMDFTVIGDTVNTASRLESLTKFYRVPILVTETLMRVTKKEFVYREIDTIRVKGKRKPIKIYEPICRVSELENKSS
ncbi:MAG: adenylate/guanylate cyclase domain-containing protein [Leptospiraceae bacterium]|nr:adenylate/guanylate cyclase domain-containing protein [Leptospiraceae bacterium]